MTNQISNDVVLGVPRNLITNASAIQVNFTVNILDSKGNVYSPGVQRNVNILSNVSPVGANFAMIADNQDVTTAKAAIQAAIEGSPLFTNLFAALDAAYLDAIGDTPTSQPENE